MRDHMYETTCPICDAKYNIIPTKESDGVGMNDEIHMYFKIEGSDTEFGDFFPKCSKCKCELVVYKAEKIQQIIDSTMEQHKIGEIQKQTETNAQIDIGGIVDVFINHLGDGLYSVYQYY